MIRVYINQKESVALSKNTMSEEMGAWLYWARKKIDWYDPLVGAEDEWFRAIRPEIIMKEDVSKNTYPWLDQKPDVDKRRMGGH